MLKVFRDNLRYLSWVLWLVIAVFVLFVFVDFGATVPTAGGAGANAAATVGDYEVSYGDFERTYRRTEDFYRQTYGDQFNRELAQQLGLPLQVLDGLIAEKILLGEADRMGLSVTDEEVARYIAEIPSFQMPDGGFIGEDKYIQVLRSNGMTVEQFEESVRTELLNTKVRSVLQENLFVSDQEVVEAYRDQTETANIRYISLAADSLREEVVIADEELGSFFADHQEDFRIPERRVVDYLLIEPDDLRSTLEVSDEDVRAYYDDNTNEFDRQEQVRARHILLQINDARTEEQAEQIMAEIRQRVDAGEAFEALATELSEDPGSKKKGGDLGLFGRGQMIREFEDAAFGAEPGQIVGPVRTSFGFHLIQVLEKIPAGTEPFDAVAEDIRIQLLGDKARTAADTTSQTLAERLRQEKLEGADAWRQLAESEAGVTFHTTEPFAREDNVPGIGRETTFTVTAFELGSGELSEPIQVSRGWAILGVSEIQEPRVPELQEVQADVENALRDERQLELATARLGEARQSVTSGISLDDVAAGLGLSVQESGEFRRQGPVTGLGTNAELTASAMALDVGGVSEPIVNNRTVVLFEVADRQRYDPAKFETEKAQATTNLRSQRLDQMLATLIDQRREELGVEYDSDLLQNFEVVTAAQG